MKNSLLKESLLKAMTIAVVLSYPALNFAAESEQLIGKNLQENKDLVDKIMKGRNHVLELDNQGQIKQVLDTGANGDGSEPLSSAPSNTTASTQTKDGNLLINYQGQDAIDYIGDDLGKTAARYNISEEKLKTTLLEDETLRVSEGGNLLYIDTANHKEHSKHHESSNNDYGQQAMLISGSPAISTTTLTQASLTPTPDIAKAFELHSKRGSNRIIYLNFRGKTVDSGTDWNTFYGDLDFKPWDLTNNSSVYDTKELNTIIQTWQTVSSIFSAFDIDVTTEQPPAADLSQANGSKKWGTEVVITNNDEFIGCGCLGTAWVGYFGDAASDPTLVFPGTSDSGKFIGKIASHEIGHRFGLLHDGTGSTLDGGYYPGHGSGETGWTPIMGDVLSKNLTQFSVGEYPNANNRQNDLMSIKSNVNLGNDDHGNSITNPSSLVFSQNSDKTYNINTPGVIETKDDIDMFVIKTDYQGTIDLKAYPDAINPTLDIEISLYNASGQLIKTDKPETTLSASLNYPYAPAGTYFVSIKNSGHTATGSDYGYSNYASLGQYRITGSYPLSTVHTPPKPIIDGSDLNGTPIKNSVLSGTAPFVVNFSSGSTSSDGTITNYYWDFGDKDYSTATNLNNATTSSTTHTFNTIGEYKVKLLTTTQYGITAQQVVTINVTRPANKTPIGLAGFEIGLDPLKPSNVYIQAYGIARQAPDYKFYEGFNYAYQFQTTGKVTKTDGTSEIITTTNDNAIVYTLMNKPAHGSLSFEVLDVAYTLNGKKVSTYIYDRTFNREPLTKTFSW